MTKHTHRGNCQICGALQAADNSNHWLAKHGYKVAGFGYFVGTCAGSDGLPLQESRTQLDAMCKDLERHAVEQCEIAADYRSGKLTPETVRTGRRVRDSASNSWVSEVIPWADANEYQRISERYRITQSHYAEARAARGHIKAMLQIAERVHGKSLVPSKPASTLTRVDIFTGLNFMHNGKPLRVIGSMGKRWWVNGTAGKHVMTSTAIRAAIRG